MLRSKKVIIMVSLLVIAAAAWVFASGSLVDQQGVLAGRVLADRLAQPGNQVKEGDVLAMVDGITGPAPAVRANTDGIVREVLIRPGDVIKAGDVLVRIESSR